MHIISTQEESPTDGERHVVFVGCPVGEQALSLSGTIQDSPSGIQGVVRPYSPRTTGPEPSMSPYGATTSTGPGPGCGSAWPCSSPCPSAPSGGCGEPGAPGAPASRSTPAATRSTRRSCSRPPPACAAVRSCHPRVAGRCPPKVVAGVLGHANISITSTPTATRSRPCRSRRRRPSPAWCSAPDAPCGQTVSIRPTSAPHE
jgi:hypothetical protein